jgi:hypothetical protein
MKTLLVSMLLIGCAVQPWTRADGTLATEHDMLACQHEADLATASAPETNTVVAGGINALLTNTTWRRAGLASNCMKLKGFERR